MNTQSDAVDQLAKALAAAQASLSAATKDAVNPHFKNHYATLQSVWLAAKEVLAPNGLSVVQTFAPTDGNRMDITTTLLHVSGQWIRGTLSMIPQRADPQGIGSAVTYGRRYALAAILGIVADEDDDGEAASRPATPARSSAHVDTPAPARAAAPARTTSTARSQPVGTVEWRTVVVPKFIKKYAGQTLGDMDEKDLLWWADNYHPKPDSKYREQDEAFKRCLMAAKAELTKPVPAGASAENLDEDVPF